MDDTPPFADEVVLWHVAFDLKQHSLVAVIFLENHPVRDGFTTIMALQRSRVVKYSHGGDVCRKVIRAQLMKLVLFGSRLCEILHLECVQVFM